MSDSSNHLPTERPSFCNWYGKYHPDTYEPHKGAQTPKRVACISAGHLSFNAELPHMEGGPSTRASGTQPWGCESLEVLVPGGWSTGQVELKWVQPKTSCFKRVIRDSLLRSKVYARTTQLQHVYVTCTKCNVEGQAVWSTRPNFWTFKETPQKCARFGISSDLGVTEIFKRIKRINVKNILPYFPRLGKDFFHPSSRPILAFGAPTFRAGQGIQKLRQNNQCIKHEYFFNLDQKLGGVFHMFEKHWNLNVDPYKFMISNISSPSKFWYFRQLTVTELFETFHHWSLGQKTRA